MSLIPKIRNYVDGNWIRSTAEKFTEVTNPATEEKLGDCPLGSEAELKTAVDSAEAAFDEWRKTSIVDRIQPLFKLKHLLEAELDQLAAMITTEHGKTLIESKGSVRRAIQMVETATSMPTLQMGDIQQDIAAGIDSYAVKKPMGVFAGISPFNFPAMVSFWFWPFAVASGNTFVLKPSERVPLTSIKLFELIDKCGFPKGVINMVHGGKEVVNAMCSEPRIKGVSFVGSTPVARHVYTEATKNGKRVQALGGAKNFMVVLPDAVMDKAARVSLESIIGCAGERCLAGSVILCVGDQTYSAMKDSIPQLASQIKIGSGLEPNTDMGPLISEQARERVSALIQSGVDDGAEILLDGRKDLPDKGYFLRPTVLANVTESMKIAKEEVFGPVVLIAKAESFSEAITWINRNPYGNTATLFTTNGSSAREFSYELDPGMIGINIGVPAPMSFFSFGGTKDSFFGDLKAHGRAGVDFFTDTQVTIQRWQKDSSIW